MRISDWSSDVCSSGLPAAANTDPSVPRDFDQAGASEISEVARSCERAGARAICQQAIGERCCAVQATKDIVPAIARKVGSHRLGRLDATMFGGNRLEKMRGIRKR